MTKIQIKVFPNSKKKEVVDGEPLVVRVTAPPEKGKANAAVLKLLAKHFGKKVRIVKGLKSREKLIELTD